MESIRNFLKSWPGRIFLMFCLSPLVILGLESYFSGSSNANEVAKVGDQSISRMEYQNRINARRNELMQSGVDPSLINNEVLNKEILQGLIKQALLRNQSQKLGMYVSDKLINDMLLKDPQFLDENGQFSNDRFAFALKQQGMTKDQLFDQYRQQLNLMQLYESVSSTALYPMANIDELIALQEETRDVKLHRLAWQDFAHQVSVSNQDIEDYYSTHKNDLNSLAMVDLSYIVLDPNQMPIETISDKELQDEYDAFKTNYEGDYRKQISQILVSGESAKDTIKTIQQRLQKGDSFEQLAKEFSEDVVSGKKGGDIGTFNPDTFGADGSKVAQAIEELAAGEISKPVKTSFGYQIFKVTDVEGDAVPTFESMREQLTTRVQQHKKEALIADKISRINDMAADGVGIEDIAQQEELKLHKLKDYTELNNQTALNQPAVIEAAFDDFTLQDESVSTSITVNNSTVWLQPSNYRPIKPLSLEQATPNIKQVLVQQEASRLALVQAEKIANRINKSNSGIKAVDIDFTALGEVSRQNPQLLPEEKAAMFSENVQTGKPIAVAHNTSHGATVLVMGPIQKPSSQQISEAERSQVANIVKQSRGQEIFSDYLHYLELATEVEKNDSVINEISGL